MPQKPFTLIGAVHLLPLPGSPKYAAPLDEIRARAVKDAKALLDAGFDGVIVENFGDAPFFPGRVEPHTVAMMAVIVSQINAMRKAYRTPRGDYPILGVNVLRNDARAALAIATATDAEFIRVNVHSGAMLTDQGIVQGQAHNTLRYRKQLGAHVQVFADVMVKHAAPLASQTLEDVAKDTWLRGLADALIVSGTGTGVPTPEDVYRRVRRAVPAPLFVGSGLTPDNLGSAMLVCDGAIVGTFLKHDGQVEQPVDIDRARVLIQARDALAINSRGTSREPNAGRGR